MENKPFDPYSQNSFSEQKDSKGVYLKDRLRMIFEKINYYLVRILPTIGNIITFIFFYIKRIITAFIKIALEQIKF
jgi:hypothetical protein